MDAWWAEQFGLPISMLWKTPVTIGMHAPHDDYSGVFVAARDGAAHVSLPTWFEPADVPLLEAAVPESLVSRDFWTSFAPTAEMTVLGPAVHAFTDDEPDLEEEELAAVQLLQIGDLGELQPAVGPAAWDESGFSHASGPVHALVEGDEMVVAAAHLATFLDRPGDLGVLVHPDRRGQGLGGIVGGAATRTAVRRLGLARWRARADNPASRALSRRLGFEDYCLQLAVRPSDEQVTV